MARARALCGLLLAASAVSRPAQPMLTYVTLWKDQMKPWGLDPDANPDALSAWLDQARGAGVSHVMISASWADVEPKEGAFDLAPLLRLIGKIGQKGLLSMVVLDAFRGPQWLFERHPDARPLGGGPPEHPCNKRIRGFTTFAHTEAFAYALRFVSTTVQEINSALGPSAVHSFQPNFNNELEARYTQECDIFLDYSPTTIAAYRQWLRAQNSDASYWSRRWGTQRGPKSGLLWSEEEQDWRWDTIKPPNVFGDTTQSVGLPTPKTQPRTRQTMRTQTPDDEHQPVTSLAYWDWLRFREVQLSHAYRTACDRVVAHGGRGCFLHFGEFFTSIDAINAVIIFELANASSITDIIVDSNFVNFGHLRVDPVMASILVSAAQPYVSGAATGKNLWFEGAAERLELASEVTPRSTDGARHRTTLDGDVEIMRQGFDHAVKAGATGLGITNLKALSFLSSILPAAPADLVVQPWKPKVLLFFPYETFYSFRRWMDKHKRDVMQKYVHHTYVHASSKCECQVQVVADAALLPVLGADRRFEKGRLWLQLPGVMPSAARNAIHSAMREGHWHVIPHSSEHWNITLPVMGRTTVQALPDFVIAGTPKGGTSSLAEWFSAAPWTAPSVQKEINFFDRHFDKGLDWCASSARRAPRSLVRAARAHSAGTRATSPRTTAANSTRTRTSSRRRPGTSTTRSCPRASSRCCRRRASSLRCATLRSAPCRTTRCGRARASRPARSTRWSTRASRSCASGRVRSPRAKCTRTCLRTIASPRPRAPARAARRPTAVSATSAAATRTSWRRAYTPSSSTAGPQYSRARSCSRSRRTTSRGPWT